jgi:dihydrofolate synthase/folylpolyglutamate synthase
MKITNLLQAATVLHDYVPRMQSVDWSFALDDMKALVNELGNPQEKIKAIHVAGTSGKTSTCYYIADMLQRSGKTVGLTVSPHVDALNERVQINGQPLEEAEFCRLLGEFIDLPAVKKHKPSYFGLLAAFAFWVFAYKQVDYAVVEVGLGGRLDATNVIERADKVSVIADIGLDHTVMLGNNVVTIAAEKAGIIKKSNQVIVNQQDQEIIEVIQQRTRQVDAELTIVKSVSAPQELPLFQQRNWSLAKATVDFVAKRDGLAISGKIAAKSATTIIPARMETIDYGDKKLIFDGAHNNQKILALCQSIKHRYPKQKLAAIVSFTHDKDEELDQKLGYLHGVIDHLIITSEQDVPKWSIEPDIVLTAAKTAGFIDSEVIPKPSEALEALSKRPEPVILITGSFYLLNLIRPLIKELQHD